MEQATDGAEIAAIDCHRVLLCSVNPVGLIAQTDEFTCTCICRLMSFLSIAFIARISPVLVQSVLEHVHCRSLYHMLR